MLNPVAVNVGCNDIHLEGHLNVDLDDNNNPQLLCDATKLDDVIQAGSVSSIYAGHLLEHLTEGQGFEFLHACKKILAPHGTLTIVIPDWRKAASRELCPSLAEAEGHILGLGQHVRLIDEDVLQSMLSSVFSEVHIVDARKVKYCLQRGDVLQSAAIAINHPEHKWAYILRKQEHPATAAWKLENMAPFTT